MLNAGSEVEILQIEEGLLALLMPLMMLLRLMSREEGLREERGTIISSKSGALRRHIGRFRCIVVCLLLM